MSKMEVWHRDWMAQRRKAYMQGFLLGLLFASALIAFDVVWR